MRFDHRNAVDENDFEFADPVSESDGNVE